MLGEGRWKIIIVTESARFVFAMSTENRAAKINLPRSIHHERTSFSPLLLPLYQLIRSYAFVSTVRVMLTESAFCTGSANEPEFSSGSVSPKRTMVALFLLFDSREPTPSPLR